MSIAGFIFLSDDKSLIEANKLEIISLSSEESYLEEELLNQTEVLNI